MLIHPRWKSHKVTSLIPDPSPERMPQIGEHTRSTKATVKHSTSTALRNLPPSLVRTVFLSLILSCVNTRDVNSYSTCCRNHSMLDSSFRQNEHLRPKWRFSCLLPSASHVNFANFSSLITEISTTYSTWQARTSQ